MRSPSLPPTPCQDCRGLCCHDKGHGFSVRLSKTDDDVKSFGDMVVHREGFSAIGVRENGACLFLNLETNQCEVYDRRPYWCKAFSCWNLFIMGEIPLDSPELESILMELYRDADQETYPGLKRRAAIANT